jgi:predicted TIM-barrel fold metal-dependent hydrolase
VEDIPFYDANCQIGRYNFRVEGAPQGALPELLSDMQEHGIARRLVYHAMAKEYDVATGNGRLMEELAGGPNLTPCWAVTTWVTGETPAPDVLIAQLRASGIRAVRFFRHSYYVPMGEWSLGALWSALECHRVPLFLDIGERWATMDPFNPDEVHALCRAHPNLPVILVKHRIRYNRQVYQLLEACPNLRLEISGYWHYRAVEEICGRFGPHRLIFGTNWPYMDSSFAIAMVMYAEVPKETKAAVAGNNLKALMEAVRW